MDKSRKITGLFRKYELLSKSRLQSLKPSGLNRLLPVYLMLTAILLVSSVNLLAQGGVDEGGYYLEDNHLFYSGLIGGVNLCQVDGDNFAGYHKAAFNFGGIGYVKLGKRVSLSWEILYSQKGAKSNIPIFSGIDSVVITKYAIDLKYAEIPVMINVFDKMKSHLNIGVSYSRLIAASETLSTSPNYPIDLTKYPFKKGDWNFLAGAQMHLIKGLFLNMRFQYSLIPIRDQTPPYFSRAQQYNNLWTLRLMYLFT